MPKRPRRGSINTTFSPIPIVLIVTALAVVVLVSLLAMRPANDKPSYLDERATPSAPAEPVEHVKGYYRKDGTYVRPHTRRKPRR